MNSTSDEQTPKGKPGLDGLQKFRSLHKIFQHFTFTLPFQKLQKHDHSNNIVNVSCSKSNRICHRNSNNTSTACPVFDTYYGPFVHFCHPAGAQTCCGLVSTRCSHANRNEPEPGLSWKKHFPVLGRISKQNYICELLMSKLKISHWLLQLYEILLKISKKSI